MLFPFSNRINQTAQQLKSRVRHGLIDARQFLLERELLALRYDGTLAGEGQHPLSLLIAERSGLMRDLSFFVGDSRNRVPPMPLELFKGSAVEYRWVQPRIASEAQHTDVVLEQRLLATDQGADSYSFWPFLDGHLPVMNTLEQQIRAVRSKAHRRRLRAVLKKKRSRFRVSNDESEFNQFYDSLYTRFVRQRFGYRAHIDPLEFLYAAFRKNGYLLVVEEDGRTVSAALCLDRPMGVLAYYRNGFADADSLTPLELSRRTAALEVALFQAAQERGAQLIDFGYTPGILNHGLFVHKRRMGCSFVPTPSCPSLKLRIRPALRPLVFSRFPLLTGKPGEYVAQVGYHPEHAPAERQLAQEVKNFSVQGLKSVVLHTLAKSTHEGRMRFEALIRQRIGEIPLRIEELPL